MEHAFADINFAAVFVAALSAFIVGGIWYGPLFSKPWMAETGMTEEKARQGHPAITFGLSFILMLVAATALAMILGKKSIVAGIIHGILLAIAFVATTMGVNDLFERRSFKLWSINAGYNLVAFTLMGAILGAWH